jgi:2-keto-4-pentenoate hydratase/2-oxohepta-3-ene-1,7-dioic acid hydratase in catechol pathway
MRLVTFMRNEVAHVGAVLDEQYIIDLNAGYMDLVCPEETTGTSGPSFVSTMRELLEHGDSALQTAQEILRRAREELTQHTFGTFPVWAVPLDEVRLTAPITNPQKVVAIGQNYRDHCLEQNAPIPERPIIFAKFPTAVIGPGEEIIWDPDLTSQVDYEAELGVVIGKRARNVPQNKAFEYVAGYLNGNDVSARDLQFGDRQWVRGKSLDTFCPLGPYLVTKEEVPDPHNLSIRSILNGEIMQNSNTQNLIFPIPFLIEFITRAFTLLPGDIILTGTPHGVGVFRDPKIFLKPGDTITIDVEKLGTLTNPVGEWKT